MTDCLWIKAQDGVERCRLANAAQADDGKRFCSGLERIVVTLSSR